MSNSKLKNKWKLGTLLVSRYHDNVFGLYLGVDKNTSGFWWHTIYNLSEETLESIYFQNWKKV